MAKVKTTWMPKQAHEQVRYPKGSITRPYKPSKHPMVKFMKQIENEDPDIRDAKLAGFQAEHCGAKFSGGREIAKVTLANGKIRRAYACDVCGYVLIKDSHT